MGCAQSSFFFQMKVGTKEENILSFGYSLTVNL